MLLLYFFVSVSIVVDFTVAITIPFDDDNDDVVVVVDDDDDVVGDRLK